MAIDEKYILEAADRVMIMDLLGRYGWHADYGTPDEWANCFIEDGIFSVPDAKIEVRGKNELREFCDSIHKMLPGLHHVMSNFVIDINGDKAHGFCELNEFLAKPDRIRPNIQGYYEDDYVKIRGKWFIAHRRVYQPEPTTIQMGLVGEIFRPWLEHIQKYVRE